MEQQKCEKCGKVLIKEEIALYKKLMNMEPKEYLCKICLADLFGCSTVVMDQKIQHFKNMGCFLFEDC